MENNIGFGLLILWIIVLFNLLLTFALIRRVNSGVVDDPTPDMLNKGEAIPNFIAKTLNGDSITLADYTQPELVFIFISYGCSHCTEKMPLIDSLYAQAKSRGTEIVVVSLSSLELTQAYVKELNFKSPVLSAFKTDTTMAEDYRAKSTPSYYHVDRHRRVVSRGLLGSGWDALVKQWENQSKSQPIHSMEVAFDK